MTVVTGFPGILGTDVSPNQERTAVTANRADDSLEQVASEVKVCPLCELCRSRTHAVPGEGNPQARVMLVGEGPGWHEDQQGKPFVGASGKFLSELLTNAGLSRDEVFITNVVKCRPPGNRDPLPDEIQACSGYLERQINLIEPDVIVTLGRFSMSKFFPGEKISKIHGLPKEIGRRLVVPMYHPAAALHQGALKATIQEDFDTLPKLLADRERARETSREREDRHSQSSLF
ncbi:MAG: uracil-DNA glycosylase [Chloroflexia bacterium]|nr:uracil-DNA glycosylase [Chloroflexia bacterium]